MEEQIKLLLNETAAAVNNITSADAIDHLRRDILGRKGKVQALFQKMKDIPPDDRPAAGQELNNLKKELSRLFDEKLASLTKSSETGKTSILDRTLPASRQPYGCRHPLNQVAYRLKSIFREMGYQVADGPEVELDYYNFEALNFPPHHPARDMQDTLYVETGALLRTHTSSVQIRVMKNNKPPLRFIAPGRVFRSDSVDASHSPVFSQIEGLWIDEGITFADLKGTLQIFIQKLWGKKIKLRFRPSFFPFTEPSAEVDIECVFCGGRGCPICKLTGWLEVLGSGMVHPNVLRAVDIDPVKYTGLAFGLGIERFAMLFFGIDDMRLFYENDIRFLSQFYPEGV